MIVTDGKGEIVLRPGTHEPLVIESRSAARPWFALPDALGKIAAEREALPTWTWNPRYQVFQDRMLIMVKCWKCGVAIQTWHPLLDRVTGMPLLVQGQPAVALKPLPHYRQGEFGCYLQSGTLMKFEFLHCADCSIASADGRDLLITHLAGLDHGLTHHRALTGGGPSKDEWAQHLHRFSGAEPTQRVGPSVNALGKAA